MKGEELKKEVQEIAEDMQQTRYRCLACGNILTLSKRNKKKCISCNSKNLKEIIEIPEVSYQKATLEDYKNKLHKWLYYTDEEIIDIQLACLIGEKVPGDPLWMFIIAPPGGAKTESIRPFSLCDDFYPLSDLTSKTFVSGLMIGKGDSRQKIEDLLPQLDKKVLIFKDFTTVLEKNADERQQIFAQLREIYDGSFSKKFGTLDKTVRYTCRFGFLAGVTPVIDKHWKLMQQLGERFLKTRWNEDAEKTTQRAREMEGKEEEMRKELNNAAMGFISNLVINASSFNDANLGEEIDDYAQFVAIARTPISIQDYRTDFYFDFIPTPERPTRLVKQLKKLGKCLAIIRGKLDVTSDEMKTIRRVCYDTIPQDRLEILKAIGKYEKNSLNGCPRALIYSEVKMPESSIIRVLEQLRMLGLIEVRIIQEQNGYGAYQSSYFYNLNSLSRDVLYPPSFTVGYSKHWGVKQGSNFSQEELEKAAPEFKEALKEQDNPGSFWTSEEIEREANKQIQEALKGTGAKLKGASNE